MEGNTAVFGQWTRGDTGSGRFQRFKGDMDPPSLYADFVRETLRGLDTLAPATRALVDAERPEQVFMTAFEDGSIGILNYEEEANVQIPGKKTVTVSPWQVKVIDKD